LTKTPKIGYLGTKRGNGGVGWSIDMKCVKCDGLMVLQSFFDHFLNFEGWKCLNCGKIVLKKEKTIEYDSFSVFYQQQKCKNRT
jgi:hypothetical protein